MDMEKAVYFNSIGCQPIEFKSPLTKYIENRQIPYINYRAKIKHIIEWLAKKKLLFRYIK